MLTYIKSLENISALARAHHFAQCLLIELVIATARSAPLMVVVSIEHGDKH